MSKSEPEGSPELIRLADVHFRWPGGRGFALKIPSFTVRKGERVLITGPSGSGKSTFLGLIAGIITPTRGAIVIGGTDVATLRGAARDRFRAERMGIIFQLFNLLPYGSAVDNVILPLSFAKERRARVAANGGIEAEARGLLEQLGLPREVVSAGPAAELSVGQQQRVAAARALIGEPELIIADEPTSALDGVAADAFLDLLFAGLASRSTTLLMVSHDTRLSPRFSRVVRFDEIAKVSSTDARENNA